jgi:hypothetical protein
LSARTRKLSQAESVTVEAIAHSRSILASHRAPTACQATLGRPEFCTSRTLHEFGLCSASVGPCESTDSCSAPQTPDPWELVGHFRIPTTTRWLQTKYHANTTSTSTSDMETQAYEHSEEAESSSRRFFQIFRVWSLPLIAVCASSITFFFKFDSVIGETRHDTITPNRVDERTPFLSPNFPPAGDTSPSEQGLDPRGCCFPPEVVILEVPPVSVQPPRPLDDGCTQSTLPMASQSWQCPLHS